jgi:hypothetical protein
MLPTVIDPSKLVGIPFKCWSLGSHRALEFHVGLAEPSSDDLCLWAWSEFNSYYVQLDLLWFKELREIISHHWQPFEGTMLQVISWIHVQSAFNKAKLFSYDWLMERCSHPLICVKLTIIIALSIF